jgi:hypothetical protein
MVAKAARGFTNFVKNVFGGAGAQAAAQAGEVFRIKKEGITFDDNRWGEKVKHTRDWGLDPSKAENRDWLRKKVVVTDMDGNFVTVLKDGINNGSFQNATPLQ